MSWPERIERSLARVDVRLALVVGGSAAALMATLLAALLAFAVLEALEEKEAELRRDSEVVAAELVARAPDAAVPREDAIRVRDAAGRISGSRGSWPGPDARAVEVTLWRALTASGSDYLRRELMLPDGTTLEVVLPLRHFVRERGELFRWGAWILGASLVATIGFGAVAARRSLAPLREATAAVRAIDARHLAARIPLRDTGDDVDALATAINEVLERMEWAFERLSGFSADVAHELRTPVNRLLNRAEVALLDARGASAALDALVSVRDTAEDMRRLIDQLLLLGQGEEGRLPLRLEEADLCELAAGIVDLYTPLAETAGQAIELAIEGTDPVCVRADTALVQRALGNLLENALRHTPRGGTIRVSVGDTSALVRLAVDDSGPGIAPPDRERVFQRFTRLDPARAPGGTGLGLAIARMIARLHGGDLVADVSPLGGASLRLVLAREPA
jgi:two-component system heavy metal sensor histidine kinase CusS